MENTVLFFLTSNLYCFHQSGKDEGLENFPISNYNLICDWDGPQNQGTTYKNNTYAYVSQMVFTSTQTKSKGPVHNNLGNWLYSNWYFNEVHGLI